MTKSIGDILKRAREKKRLTLEDVYKNIKIHPNYIKALEADEYAIFSGKVHSKGFLKIYAEYLELNIDEITALWRREYEHEFDAKENKQMQPKRFIETPKLLITPALLLTTITIVILSLFFGYLYFQYKNFTGAPNLIVNYPPNNLVTQTDILDITGKTDLDSEIFVNSEKVILNPDGSFVESVRLREGLNTISIKATNKFSKQTEFIRTIIYRPEKPAGPEAEVVQEATQTTPSVTPSAEQ